MSGSPQVAQRKTLEFVRRGMGGATRGRFFVAHGLSPDVAAYPRDALEAAYETTEISIVETGVVMATHTGTGWGISFVPGGSSATPAAPRERP